MVRTTETGGIKLIYNGTPTDGTCVATGADTTIGTASMNAGYRERYMYSDPFVFEIGKQNMNKAKGMVFGKSVTYANGVYTLQDTITLSDNYQNEYAAGYRYTCVSETVTSCSTVRYYDSNNGIGLYSVEFSGGITLDDAIANFTYKSTNDADSALKKSIDTWYKNQITNYSNSFEDAVWCVDSSIVNTGSSIGSGFWGTSSFNLSTFTRVNAKTPSLVCANNSDQLTVYKENGNGDLTYPVAQITVDEAMLAGFTDRSVTNSFLNTGDIYFTLSPQDIGPYQTGPSHFGSTYILSSSIRRSVYTNDGSHYNSTFGLRPMVSLKVGTTYTSGTGTSSDPYIIET